MPDKSKQIYELYKSKGLISKTDYDTFKSADAKQVSALYKLGVDNGLFKSTDLETFSTAFTTVKKKDSSTAPKDSQSVSVNGDSDWLGTNETKQPEVKEAGGLKKVDVSKYEKQERKQASVWKKKYDELEGQVSQKYEGFGGENVFEGWTPGQIEQYQRSLNQVPGNETTVKDALKYEAIHKEVSENPTIKKLSSKVDAYSEQVKEAKLNNKAVDILDKVDLDKKLDNLALTAYENVRFLKDSDTYVSDLNENFNINTNKEELDFTVQRMYENRLNEYKKPIRNNLAKSKNPQTSVVELLGPELNESTSELMSINGNLNRLVKEKDDLIKQGADHEEVASKWTEIRKLKSKKRKFNRRERYLGRQSR